MFGRDVSENSNCQGNFAAFEHPESKFVGSFEPNDY